MDPFFGAHLAVPSKVAGEDFGTEGTSLGGGSVGKRPIKATFGGNVQKSVAVTNWRSLGQSGADQ
jgi:hypothetical protein